MAAFEILSLRCDVIYTAFAMLLSPEKSFFDEYSYQPGMICSVAMLLRLYLDYFIGYAPSTPVFPI
jgi:hypothetical protein